MNWSALKPLSLITGGNIPERISSNKITPYLAGICRVVEVDSSAGGCQGGGDGVELGNEALLWLIRLFILPI